LASWENAIMATEGGLVATERALGKACIECNVKRDSIEAIWQDYQAKLRASTAGHQRSLDIN
jgi:hypothetical protein